MPLKKMKKSINYTLAELNKLVHDFEGYFADREFFLKSNQLSLLKEDMALTTRSLNAKDSVTKLSKQTIKLANIYYGARLYEICAHLCRSEFEKLSTVQRKKIGEIMGAIRQLPQSSRHSYYNEAGFFRPAPDCLLFSQQYHAPHFSNKSGRSYVQGKNIEDIVSGLQEEKISPNDLRVQIYLAEFKGKVFPFVYNNRTWTVFSRANIPATRIVPVLATQDLLNRITALVEANHDPNWIMEEGSDKREKQSRLFSTPSQRPFSGLRLLEEKEVKKTAIFSSKPR